MCHEDFVSVQSAVERKDYALLHARFFAPVCLCLRPNYHGDVCPATDKEDLRFLLT